jgi:hypothetical protein
MSKMKQRDMAITHRRRVGRKQKKKKGGWGAKKKGIDFFFLEVIVHTKYWE